MSTRIALNIIIMILILIESNLALNSPTPRLDGSIPVTLHWSEYNLEREIGLRMRFRGNGPTDTIYVKDRN